MPGNGPSNFRPEFYPVVPFLMGAYSIGKQVKVSAGVFIGAFGQYKGTVPAWVMVFDSVGAPANGTAPIAAISVYAASAAGDIDWYIAPNRPFLCSSGIYIALSTTGGTFAASANTDLTGTIIFI